jgi:hypothetical protein
MEVQGAISMQHEDTIPVFYGDQYPQLGEFLARRVAPELRAHLVFEPMSADELPGRRIRLDDEPLCRVVPNPADPRPLPALIGKHIDAASLVAAS